MNLHYATMKQQQHMANFFKHPNLHVQHWNSIVKPFHMTWFSHVFQDNVAVSERECNHALIPVN